MKNVILCLAVLSAAPAFATITNVQSNAKWTCTGTGTPITCTVTLTTQPTSNNNLLAVWVYWQSSSTYTAGVADSAVPLNTFNTAVGPTLQSASTTPISSQIFYAKKITGSGIGTDDIVTVTLTCVGTTMVCMSASITSGGIVAVEYSGADIYYPLDSVSAGYSTSGNPTSLLDSGTVAPANANLLVFGGGTSDTGTANLPSGSPFTVVQKSGSSLTEQLVVTGNSALQRATVCLNTVGAPCTPTTNGNWVMQMAVFRDASWTVAGGGWLPVRPGQVLYAD